jgi:hypothetical protein
MKIKIIIYICFLLLSSACAKKLSNGFSVPGSDKAAIVNFRNHRVELEEISRLISGTELMYLHSDGRIYPPDFFQNDIAIKMKLIDLMRRSGVESINGPGSGYGIRCIYTSTGMATGGTSKSYWKGQPDKTQLVLSIENYKPVSAESFTILQFIESEWYLRLDYDD